MALTLALCLIISVSFSDTFLTQHATLKPMNSIILPTGTVALLVGKSAIFLLLSMMSSLAAKKKSESKNMRILLLVNYYWQVIAIHLMHTWDSYRMQMRLQPVVRWFEFILLALLVLVGFGWLGCFFISLCYSYRHRSYRFCGQNQDRRRHIMDVQEGFDKPSQTGSSLVTTIMLQLYHAYYSCNTMSHRNATSYCLFYCEFMQYF